MRAAAPICFSKGKAAELHVTFCLILLGLGIAIPGLLHLLRSWAWWVPLLPGFVLGLVVMVAAQKNSTAPSWAECGAETAKRRALAKA